MNPWLLLLAVALQDPPARLGTIDFPTSGSAAAQPHFIRGVLFLHSFEYDSAAQEFRAAERLDSAFAMAYWGEAMSYTHPVWDEQDLAGGRAALSHVRSAPTARERAYVDAVTLLYGGGAKPHRDTLYSAAMEHLAAAYPHDQEAQVLFALSLLGLNRGVRDVPTYLRAAAIAESVFHRNPDHPGAAHYIIHAYDDPAHAPRGLAAARAYSRIASGAAHAQHMTTHIFLAMGMWDDVVSQNEIASGHDHGGWSPGHYTTWLGYAYLQQGRYVEAERLIETLAGNAGGRPQRLGIVANLRAREAIETERWSAVAPAEPTAGEDGYSYSRFVAGFAAARRGDRAGAERVLALLAQDNRDSEARVGDTGDKVVPLILEKELRAELLRLDGQGEAAVALLNQATALEDGMPFEFGPPVVVKPSHELLGETLLALQRAPEAVLEFRRGLALAPNRARSLLGLLRAAQAAGDSATAAEATRALRVVWHRADVPLP